MKQCAVLILTSLFILNLNAQDCDYNYGSSLMLVNKSHELTKEQEQITKIKIQEIKSCIETVSDSTQLFWLYNAAAFYLIRLDVKNDSMLILAQRAFVFNSERLCQDYVKMDVCHEKDIDLPMKMHYLDQIESDSIKYIRKYCLDNYKEAELQLIKDAEDERLAQKAKVNFNQNYFDALKSINTADQKMRKEESIDWDAQNSLDAINRAKLDLLYEKYGFPTNEKVTKAGTMNAFLVLHHSTDCQRNEKWTIRFLKYADQINVDKIFSFYFYRNFNEEDGSCKDNVNFIQELKTGPFSDVIKEYFDFKNWQEKFNKN